MAGDILLIIVLVPVYGLLIWTYFHPKEGMLLGRRWTFKQEPNFSDGAIQFTKFLSIIMIFMLTILFVSPIINNGIVNLILLLGLLVYIGVGGYRLLKG